MPRTSFNRTCHVNLSLDPETRARLGEYSQERRLSISRLITEWIWNTELKSDEKPAEADEEAGN